MTFRPFAFSLFCSFAIGTKFASIILLIMYKKWTVLFFPALACLIAGCMSPERAVRETRETGCEIAGEYIEKVTGRTNEFTIIRPADRLRNRLLVEQGLKPELAAELAAQTGTVERVPLPDPLVLSLTDAIIAGAANDEKYQAQKESVFSAALGLDSQRHAFENTFAGALGGGYSGSRSSGGGGEGEGGGSSSSSSAKGDASSSLSKKFTTGLSVATSLGLDVVKLLTGGSGSTLGLNGDASVTMPLLRGSGRAIVREALTQAERNLLYSVYNFESFRQSYAIDIASQYYNMLQTEQNLIALRDNSKRLTDNYKRAQMLYDAGRMTQVDLDQTRQDLLKTGDSLIESERSRQAELDAFKMALGLPVDARVELDMAELDKVSGTLSNTETNALGHPIQPPLQWTEDEAIAIALTNRIEMILAEYKLEDTRRSVKIAEDNLGFDLSLKGGVNIGQSKKSGSRASDSTGYSLTLNSDLPWDRRNERNAYEAAVRSLETEERAFEILKDSTRQMIRDDFRSINSAWNSYVIQSEALTVAQRRVRSTTLFQQAGRSSTRDLLEAEDALLSAHNSVIGAIVTYRMAGLKLKRDMSLLTISEEGLLLED